MSRRKERQKCAYWQADFAGAAALLVHAAAIENERDKLHTVIKQRFALDDAATDELIAKATVAEHKSVNRL